VKNHPWGPSGATDEKRFAKGLHKRVGQVSEKKRSFCGRQKYFIGAFSCDSFVYPDAYRFTGLHLQKKHGCGNHGTDRKWK
jgi:hypothetical protein